MIQAPKYSTLTAPLTSEVSGGTGLGGAERSPLTSTTNIMSGGKSIVGLFQDQRNLENIRPSDQQYQRRAEQVRGELQQIQREKQNQYPFEFLSDWDEDHSVKFFMKEGVKMYRTFRTDWKFDVKHYGGGVVRTFQVKEDEIPPSSYDKARSYLERVLTYEKVSPLVKRDLESMLITARQMAVYSRDSNVLQQGRDLSDKFSLLDDSDDLSKIQDRKQIRLIKKDKKDAARTLEKRHKRQEKHKVKDKVEDPAIIRAILYLQLSFDSAQDKWYYLLRSSLPGYGEIFGKSEVKEKIKQLQVRLIDVLCKPWQCWAVAFGIDELSARVRFFLLFYFCFVCLS